VRVCCIYPTINLVTTRGPKPGTDEAEGEFGGEPGEDHL
jgi:hypothetical protein